jgi:hypothetical protein
VIKAIAHDLLPETATAPSDRQRLFMLFFLGTLVDLVILGLFAEYVENIYVSSFTTALLAAILLQILLKATIILEHRVLALFRGKAGAWWKTLKFLTAWVILFGSKFVILDVLSLTFGKEVRFEGIWHGVLWVILVAVTMVVIEELVARFYRRLA